MKRTMVSKTGYNKEVTVCRNDLDMLELL